MGLFKNIKNIKKALMPVRQSAAPTHFQNRVHEPHMGAWERNDELNVTDVLTCPPVFTCISMISSDIAKLRINLVKKDEYGITRNVSSPSFNALLRNPNHYQSQAQFIEAWVISKLTRGNAYILKERDARGVVIAMHVLNPDKVKVLVSDTTSDVFYQLMRNELAGVNDYSQNNEAMTVPAREIIHDRYNCLYHPLVGLSPIAAAGMNAYSTNQITSHSSSFFKNHARPGGIITAPEHIPEAAAQRVKEYWQQTYANGNSGKIAVLGDGLTFNPVDPVTAVDSQLIEQLRFNLESVVQTFRIPLELVTGSAANNNIAHQNQIYYSRCLQSYIEQIEWLLDDGLGIGEHSSTGYEIEFDVTGLLRMDQTALVAYLETGVGAGIMSPNEARSQLNLAPVEGGESPLMQQQNYSLSALSKRDQQDDPFSTSPSQPVPVIEEQDEEGEDVTEKMLQALFTKDIREQKQ